MVTSSNEYVHVHLHLSGLVYVESSTLCIQLRVYVLDSLTDNETPYGIKAIQGIQRFLSCVSGGCANFKPIWLKVAGLLTCD